LELEDSLDVESNAGPPKNDFHDLVMATLDSTLHELLGSVVRNAMVSHLTRSHGLNRKGAPTSVDELCRGLEISFGVGGRLLEYAIARRLYAKLSVDFTDDYGKRLSEYVGRLKEMGSG
jgi:hypothetical protein